MESNSSQSEINSNSNHREYKTISVQTEPTLQTPRIRNSSFYYFNASKDSRNTAPWQPCRARKLILDNPNEPNNNYLVETCDGRCQVSFVPEHFLAFRDLYFDDSANTQFGTRVIAQRDQRILPHIRETINNIFLCDEEYGKYYAGIAVESINLGNVEHFLVFFDDGHVQYVRRLKIRNVLGEFTWDAIHENLAKFIRYYSQLKSIAIDSELNLNYIRLSPGKMIKVELDGHWRKARVMVVFHKIIKIQFEILNRFEWLYCESPRFENTWRYIISNRILNECLSPVIINNGNNVIHLDDGDDNDPSDDAFWKQLSRHEILKQMNSQINEPTQPIGYHKCNRGCLSIQEKMNELCQANQLARPLTAGWKVIRINDDVEQNVAYVTPCGQMCKNMKEVHIFLMRTKSQVGIDSFTFETSIDCTRISDKSSKSIVLNEDISMGLEYLPIQVVSHSNTGSPDPFKYTIKMVLTPGIPRFMCNPYRKVCCDCEDDCSDIKKCACWQLNKQNAENGKNCNVTGYYEYKRLQNRFDGGIYECHEGCKCKKNCFNRVAQQPLSHFLEIFKTNRCGWGLRCMNDLPKGTFVLCYFGEIIADQNADARAQESSDMYFYNLNVTRQVYGRHKPQKKGNRCIKIEILNYFPVNVVENIDLDDNDCVIDAKFCGNASRFLNHSCDPNMFTQDVYIDTHDDRFPRLAFFTSRNVQAGEELTIDYGYKPDSIEGRLMTCECGSTKCRLRLL